jgi:hypothetical protein
VNDLGHAITVGSLFDDEDLEIPVRLGESACDNATGETA